MPFAEDDELVQELPPDVADESLEFANSPDLISEILTAVMDSMDAQAELSSFTHSCHVAG